MRETDAVIQPWDDELLLGPLDEFNEMPSAELVDIADAFRANLVAVSTLVSLPYHVVNASLEPDTAAAILARRELAFRSLHEYRVPPELAGAGFFEVGADRAKGAAAAIHGMQEDLRLLKDRVAAGVANVPKGTLARVGIGELLLQTVVLCWSSLEVLVEDTVVHVLNVRPSDALRLLTEKATSKLFEGFRVDVDLLAANGFDLSRRMGTLLVGTHPPRNIEAMKALLKGLCPKDRELHVALAAKALRILNKQRHVIVHRRGVVDQAYVMATGESIAVGSKLEPSQEQLLSFALAVRSAGCALLKAARELFSGAKAG